MLSNNGIRNIVGVIGNAISLGLFLSPAPTFLKIWRRKSVEQFSPVPYLTMLANCMLWVFYGLPIVHPNTILVATINGVGALIITGYLSLFIFHAPKEMRTKVLGILAAELVFMAILVTLVITIIDTHHRRSLIVGLLALVSCIGMYASPLSVMKLVIKTKSVKYMPFWLSFAGFLNGVCWTSYALIKIDIFILIPNGVGVILGLLQLIMYLIYYKCHLQEEHEEEEEKIDIA